MTSLLLRVLLPLLVLPLRLAAQPATAEGAAVPIAAIIHDSDGDRRADREGDTVTVAGRASVASRTLYRGFLAVWIEDATAGIMLYRPGKPGTIAEGDSVVATGVVTHYLGLTEIVVADYRVIPGPRRLPTTAEVSATPEAMDARSGRLGTLEGVVVGWGSDAGGVYALLRGDDGKTHVALYVSTPIVARLELTQYGHGDRLRVSGIVVPFSPSDERPGVPRATHRVIPRSPGDIALVGMSSVLRTAVRLAMPLVLLVLIAAVVAVVLLRREVRRKTNRLMESEQRYRSLYDYNPDAVAEYDLTGRLRAANAALEAMSGYSRQELMGRSLHELAFGEEGARLLGHFDAAVRGTARHFELRLRRRDGERRVLQVSVMPVVINGQVTGVYGIGKDVTESVEARAALEANAHLLTTVVETQHAIASAELDVHAVVQRIIEQVPKLTPADFAEIGFVDADAIDFQPSMRTHGAGQRTRRLPLVGSIAGEAVRHGQVLRCDDALVDARVHAESQRTLGMRSILAVPLSYGGATIGVLVVAARRPGAFGESDERTLQLLAGLLAAALSHARDFEAKQALVAERTAALEALTVSEERFRSMIEHASDPAALLAADGTFLWASPANERVLGRTPASLVGVDALSMIHPDDVGAVSSTLAAMVAAPGGTASVEYRYRHQDGSWRVLQTFGRNLLDDPAVGGVVLNSRDVTEQRRLEEHLRQAQKMEAVGQLAGGIAHDFNNILTVIRMHSGFLLEALAERDPRRPDAEEIQRAGNRAAALTRQLLAFSRRQILQPRVLDLNESVEGMAPMLRRLIGEDISIVTHLTHHVGRVLTDPGQLEQVLMNLVVNARDAMPHGGTLTVGTREVAVDEAHPLGATLRHGRHAVLEVADTGIGMDAAVRRRVFEPFFTTKEQGKGTGLGLATAYGVVEQSGGTIVVESEPGRGSTFRVYLPCVTDPPPSAPAVAPGATGAEPTPPRGNETILLVEDEDAVRTLTRRILAGSGYRIVEARNGREALDAAGSVRGPIDLVLTDVVMPEMGGRELAEAMAVARPETPVLFMSGYTDDDILRRGLHAPGAAFLPKPFTVRDLTETVRRALDAATASPPSPRTAPSPTAARG